MANLKDYLNGTLSQQAEEKIREILSEDCLDSNLNKELEEYFNSMTDADPQLADKAYAKAENALGLKGLRVKTILYKWTGSVAAILLAFFVGLWAWNQYEENFVEIQWIEKRVDNGEIVSLQLPDGSHLYMNSGSRVTYPQKFIGKTRQIFVDGEIFADIAKDPKRPFLINSGDVSIDVLGTTFNMKSYSNAECVEVILLEGSVRFNVLNKSAVNDVILKPGNMLQYHRSTGKINLDKLPQDSYTSFHENRSIHFFNLTLEDIVTDLERMFCTKIVIMNESLAKTRYFAYFGNNESLDEILNAINSDKKIKISKRQGVIYLK